jgi:hypothetical protein
MVEIKPGEAAEVSIQKYIEQSVPLKTAVEHNGLMIEKESCRNWKSADMIACIENIISQNMSSFDCRIPMTLNRGKAEMFL